MDSNTITAARAAIVGGPRWQGVERGVYEIALVGGARVEIDLTDAVLMRQTDRLLQRVVDENYEALSAVACCAEPARLLALAFEAVTVARGVGYVDGSYRVHLRGGRVVEFYVTSWDCSLLRRYDELLGRVAEALQEAA